MRVAHVCHPDTGSTAQPVVAHDHFVIQPNSSPVRPGVQTVTLPVVGRPGSRMMRYRGLRAALADAELVRVYADPGSALALQVARIGRRRGGPPLVIEVEHRVGHVRPVLWRVIARWVLRQADAAIVRHGDGLSRLRRLGFRGIGFVAGTGVVPPALMRRPHTDRLTVALAPAPLTVRFGVIDVLEAVAAHPDARLIAAPLDGHNRLSDRAAALNMVDRLEFMPAEELLTRADVLVVVPHPRAATLLPYDRMIEQAQSAHIPVICADVAGLAEVTGPGGWIVPPYDAGAIFEVLRTRLDRLRLEAVGAIAAEHAAARQADPLDGPGLGQVMEAASARSRRTIAAEKPAARDAKAAVQP